MKMKYQFLLPIGRQCFCCLGLKGFREVYGIDLYMAGFSNMVLVYIW